jgi:sarcosine oxidase subunit gamma
MSEPLATVTRVPHQGMVTIRGDLQDADLGQVITDCTGHALPAPRQRSGGAETALAWMSPDELMFFCPADAATDHARRLAEAFGDRFALAVDVSDARVTFALSGPHWREVLAKLSPANLAPGALGESELRRTRLGQVPAALWQTGPDSAQVMVFRSVADYAEALLVNAARPGSGVGVF